MDFALPRQDHVMGFGILLEYQRRVFLAQLGDGRSQLDLVLAVLRRHRQAIDRRQPSRAAAGRRRDLAVDRVSPVTKGSSLRQRHRVAGLRRRVRLICLSPHQREDAADAGFAPARAMQHRAVLELAAQHPHQAELAAMAAMEGLENLHHRIAAAGEIRRAPPQPPLPARHGAGP